MMVTFVSQCEKNALKKTRRVLDAFANRIGDNTWQTVITEDGLITVKSMLRKTASKSTAVSCHWIRSRARSQFLWVVGNKNQFNSEGVVAVNYSNVIDIKMDEIKVMNEIEYANTNKQPLTHHLFAVGTVASMLIECLVTDGVSRLKQSAFLAGCFHDIGKLDPEYQSWVQGKINKSKQEGDDLPENGSHIDKGKFSFDKHPRHNEISLWLMQFIDLKDVLSNTSQQDFIEHAVYWHHAKPIRNDEYQNFNDIHRKLKSAYKEKGLKELVVHAGLRIKEVFILANNSQSSSTKQYLKITAKYDEDVTYNFRKQLLPDYKRYDIEEDIDDYTNQVNFNAKANLIRACVISADRQISALTAEQLQNHIENKSFASLIDNAMVSTSSLVQEITDCLIGFDNNYPNSDRNQKQSITAKKLLDTDSVAVLSGPAGCGKTKIALEWAKLSEATKIIWICPRVQICEGLFIDLASDEYLPKSKIEICTGEIKEASINGIITTTEEGNEFSGDIVITTIDQVINSITTHSNVTALIDFMNCHVVFDEYHEYIPMPAFNLLFAELIKCKRLKESTANTLLVSATPNYCYLEQVLELEQEDIIDIPSFNQSQYQFTFKDFDESKKDQSNPLFMQQSPNTIVISNTATTAQQAFILNQALENALVFHGKFKTADKKVLFEKVYNNFKKNGLREVDVLRSGPIVQASLNITCHTMVSELTLAENWLQRLGRLDRFGDNKGTNDYITAIPLEIKESNGKIKGNCARFLNGNNSYRSAYAWYEFLQNELINTTYDINQIYKLYREFYQSTKGLDAVEQDLLTALKNSVKVINAKVHDPIRFIKKLKSTDKKKLKKSSLRGDSRFVQMAECKILNTGKVTFTNQYICDGETHVFTMSVDEIEGHDPSGDKNLLAFMHKKHHKIQSAKEQKSIKQVHKSFMLKNEATDPDAPIYVSYTNDDLALCNDNPCQHAIYYVMGEKQAIGAMSYSKFNIETQPKNNKE